jgi:hypothetical protein|tara:strand:- start:599 stop:778 length:180 start_codon:yes stop_codon:yes gene_type:complete
MTGCLYKDTSSYYRTYYHLHKHVFEQRYKDKKARENEYKKLIPKGYEYHYWKNALWKKN